LQYYIESNRIMPCGVAQMWFPFYCRRACVGRCGT